MDYTKKWGNILTPYKNITKNYLEIGLFKGITLPIWQEYFNCKVHGIDINLANLEIDKSCFHVYELDATNPRDVPKNFNKLKFEVIVDDSNPEKHYDIFEIYQHFLAKDGIYIIETYKANRASKPLYSLLLDYVKLVKNYSNFNFHIGSSALSNQQIIYGYKKVDCPLS